MEHLHTNKSFECAFYKRGQGNCIRGATCKFIHAEHTEGLANIGASLMPVRHRFTPSNFYWPSNYWPNNTWSNNTWSNDSWSADCPQPLPVVLSHSNAHVTPKLTEAEELTSQEEVAAPELAWIRHLKGVFVTFGEGATVATVALPWDTVAVRLSKLPQDSTTSTVAELIENYLGARVIEANIQLLSAYGGRVAADVTLDDQTIATDLVTAVREDQSTGIDADRVIPVHHRAARFNTISRNKVSCSWHKPSRTVTLSFSSQFLACETWKKFLTGVYQVSKSRVWPSRPHNNGSDTDTIWKFKIDNVPTSANRNDIIEQIDEPFRPLNVHMSWASYSNPMEASVDQIMRNLSTVGPMDPFVTTGSSSQSRRSKMTVRFVDIEHAIAAVQEFDEQPLPFFSQGKLTVQQLSTIRMCISNHVFTAASQDIEALYSAWKKDHVYTTISKERKPFRHIKFEGQMHEKVVKAQAAFENVTAGELLRMPRTHLSEEGGCVARVSENGAPLWSASLATKAWAYHEMRNIEHKLGVLVLCDKQKRNLRLLGRREEFGSARKQIAKLCNEDPRCEFSIPIDHHDGDALRWLLAGGYQDLGRTVGLDKVALDVASQPRRLIISGTDHDYQNARNYWDHRYRNPDPTWSINPGQCNLCGLDAEYPVCTGCDHLYCTTCFEDMCFSGAGTPVPEPAIRCYGDGGKCMKLLTMTNIQENVSSFALELIFERMFKTFVSQNPEQYRLCPTHTCEQVYRVKMTPAGVKPTDEFEFNCPQCNLALCSTCHVSHETIHCPLREIEEDEEL
ncbi:ATP-dependent RNA helicase DEAH12, chloroplastic [Beauveria bassiana]|nr:ATP-dependent RNA helicase DEAH12, chloroplastic [Beauveria bassiana]KAH8708176.1 ATP-dependent RNA helicase DEAH12, chloroplastic [Beauveria bassiana]